MGNIELDYSIDNPVLTHSATCSYGTDRCYIYVPIAFNFLSDDLQNIIQCGKYMPQSAIKYSAL